MKKLFRALAASLSALLTALALTVSCFALHSDEAEYKNKDMWDMEELAKDSDGITGYGYVTENTSIGESTCIVVQQHEALIILSGNKLTVNGALHILGGLYIEKGARLDIYGELCIDGSAVNAGELRAFEYAEINLYKRGSLYCTPSSVTNLKKSGRDISRYGTSDLVIAGKYSVPDGGVATEPIAAVMEKKNGTDAERRVITDKEELAALLPDSSDFRTGQYLDPDDELTCTTVFFDNGSSLPVLRSGGRTYAVFTIDVRQPRTAGEACELDAEYEYIPDIVRYTVKKNGKIKITENSGGAPAKYLKKLDALKLIEYAGMWYGSPSAKVYDAGGGYVLFTAPESVDKYSSGKVYEAVLYKKK